MKNEKVVLAYSGGLDTSVILKWLENKYRYDVVAVCVDVGQKDDFVAVKKKALETGAIKAYVVDVKEEYVKDYVFPTLKAGAKYEDEYLLGTSTARPLIAKKLVEIAELEGAVAIAHGCTGKGNDQVRFETTIKALNPHLKIIAPWRTWDLKSREDCIDYAKANDIPIPVSKKDDYSRDGNVFHLSHEGGNLENTWNEHDASIYQMTVKPEDAPDEPTYVTIGFEQGIPVTVDGEELSPLKLLQKLNKIAGANGVGVIDIVENRLVGMKSRGVYETPGGTVLYKALQNLEKLVMDRDTQAYKKQLSHKYSEIVYDGVWFTPLKKAFDAFLDSIHEASTGEVKLKLYKGSMINAGAKSIYSLYNEDFATFGEDDVYNQYDAEGFINLFSLPLKIRAMMNADNKKRAEEIGKEKQII